MRKDLDDYKIDSFIERTCPDCWETYWQNVRATKITRCPECQKLITREKNRERKRKQREKMSRLQNDKQSSISIIE